METGLVEMECLVCGNHDLCDPKKARIYCGQCDNGLMVVPRRE